MAQDRSAFIRQACKDTCNDEVNYGTGRRADDECSGALMENHRN